MRVVIILQFIAVAILITPGFVEAMPNRENNKDYLAAAQPWFSSFRSCRGIDWSRKHFPFEMRGKEWDRVVHWLADQADLDFVPQVPPPEGCFTFINPIINGKPNEYTLLESFDIVNEVLQGCNKLTLIRGDTTLTLVSMEPPLHLWSRVPRVQIRDLPSRGRTEVVEVVARMNPLDVAAVMQSCEQFEVATPLDLDRVLLRKNVAALVELMRRVPMADPS